MKRLDRLLPVGTRSVLWGVHCFCIHPWFVAAAWWRLYGFPWDPRLWLCFILHDLGYWGKPNLDGPEGERHVEWAARVMSTLFDRASASFIIVNTDPHDRWRCGPWGQLCLFHSRFYAKQYGFPFSRLCVADKLALCIEPWWLYLPRAWASGELREYMARAGGKDGGKYAGEPNTPEVAALVISPSPRDWHRGMTTYMRAWVETHRDGRADTWTPAPKDGRS